MQPLAVESSSRPRRGWTLLLSTLALGAVMVAGHVGAAPERGVKAQPVEAGAGGVVDAAPAPEAEAAASPASVEVAADVYRSPLWWTGQAEGMLGRNDPRNGRFEPRLPKRLANGTYSYEAIFEEDLFQQLDLVLPGISTSQTLVFPSPRLWQLLPGSQIHLRLDHSSALLPEDSFLTVEVNDRAVASIALTAKNVIDGELIVDLPVEGLKDYNTLKLTVNQHYTHECEDPFSSSLWTKVSRRSSLKLLYKPRELEPDLLAFPLPLFDYLGYGPAILNYVLPRSPSAQTLEALGVVSAGLGREVSYHPLLLGAPVESVGASPGNTILVGTPSENPEILEVLGSRARDLGPGQGMVALLPHPGVRYAAILVVTGADPSGVLLAAKALTTDRRKEVLSGSSSVVTRLIDGDPSQARDRDNFVPPKEMFLLEDLGQDDITAHGFFASPIVVPVRSMPDMAFTDGHQRLKVYYGYGSQLHTRLSTLEVRWNNISLKSIPLDNPEGEQKAEAEVSIPGQVIAPYNSLEFVFHLIPKAYEPCEVKTDKQLYGTIFADTAFYMPRYHWAEMPDLGKLQYAMYPMGIFQDLSDTVVVTPDNPDTNDLMATVALTAELGRGTVAHRVALRTVRGDAVSASDRSGNHLVLLASANRNSEVEALGDKRPLALADDHKNLNRDDAVVLQAIDPAAHGTLEELISPYANEKAILILQGRTTEHLINAIKLLADPSLASQLSGNVALLGVDRNIRTVQIGSTSSFGTIPAVVKARDWGRTNLGAVLLLLLAFLLLAFLVLSFLLGRYRRDTHDDDPDPDDDRHGPAGGGPGPAPIHRNPETASLHYAEAAAVEPATADVHEPTPLSEPGERPVRRPPPRRPAPSDDGRSPQ